jgi:hypothetical protein
MRLEHRTSHILRLEHRTSHILTLIPANNTIRRRNTAHPYGSNASNAVARETRQGKFETLSRSYDYQSLCSPLSVAEPHAIGSPDVAAAGKQDCFARVVLYALRPSRRAVLAAEKASNTSRRVTGRFISFTCLMLNAYLYGEHQECLIRRRPTVLVHTYQRISSIFPAIEHGKAARSTYIFGCSFVAPHAVV